MQPATMSAGSVVTGAGQAKSKTVLVHRWITPVAEVETPRQHVYVKRSPAAQIGSISLDRYFDGIDPNHTVFCKNPTPLTSLPQSAFPKMMKALRFFKP